MQLHCTRPGCPRPLNSFADLDDNQTLKTVQQKFCTTCGMPLILIGRYLPLKLLGQGGFGAAFLARDRYTPAMRPCVVKQFQPAGTLTPSQLATAQGLFEREGEVLEQLGTHPQIPDLYAFFELTVPSFQPGKEDKFFYLVQEFIDGQDLEEELADKGRLSEPEVREILGEILEVLTFVHDNQSIHRDIKPSNIMRQKPSGTMIGNKGKVYLLDFGAVKQVATGAGAGAQSSTGIYSMGYAPPEQMSSSQVYPSSDLYALAVTCITLLTGKQPADLYDPYHNTWNWRSHTQVSDRLADVLDRMLLSTPNQRFPSARDVLAALKPAPAPPPVSPAPRPTSVTPPSPPAPSTSLQKPPPAAPAPRPPRPPRPAPSFSVLEFLAGAGFAGFEG
ncbi:MAG: serine/threonine-protein kinase, partial [Leptolyngbyaceae bacterium]|nr:serine/threonine-protein kinase [Leptolyngbyaceae bacterium]